MVTARFPYVSIGTTLKLTKTKVLIHARIVQISPFLGASLIPHRAGTVSLHGSENETTASRSNLFPHPVDNALVSTLD